MNKGFTLVELSIVLVIVGLLIDGILVGQSLMSSAKLTNLVKTLGQYDAMVYNFKTKFKNQLPGDSRSFTSSGPGPGNGIIDIGVFNNSWQSQEVFNFWLHLNQSGLLSKKYSGYTGFTTFAGDFTPYSPKLNYGTNSFLNAGTLLIANGNASNWGNSWLISGGASGGVSASLTPEEAFEVDSKLDDGLPVTGDVQVLYLTSAFQQSGAGYTGSCATQLVWPAFKYTITTTTATCGIAVKTNW